jgi:WD40 repeat protein
MQASPHGSQVVTASNDHTARVWDADTGEPVSPPLRHQEAVRFAQFSPDGRLVVTASGDSTGGKGVARVWDASSGEAITPPLRHDGWVIHASFSPDSRRIVTGSIDETARVWDLSPENRPVEDLVLLAQLYSGHRLDPIAGLVQVDTKRLQLAWKKLREK